MGLLPHHPLKAELGDGYQELTAAVAITGILYYFYPEFPEPYIPIIH